MQGYSVIHKLFNPTVLYSTLQTNLMHWSCPREATLQLIVHTVWQQLLFFLNSRSHLFPCDILIMFSTSLILFPCSSNVPQFLMFQTDLAGPFSVSTAHQRASTARVTHISQAHNPSSQSGRYPIRNFTNSDENVRIYDFQHGPQCFPLCLDKRSQGVTTRTRTYQIHNEMYSQVVGNKDAVAAQVQILALPLLTR